MDLYGLAKFIHVVAVIIWLGGAAAMAALVLSVARSDDRVAIASVVRQVSTYAHAIMGPTSIVTLASGVWMLWLVGLSPETLWVAWGLAAILLHFVVGGVFIRRTTLQLGSLAASPDATDAAIAVLRRRLGRLDTAYLALLLSVVAAMTMKPGL